jgi:hypothetical protein
MKVMSNIHNYKSRRWIVLQVLHRLMIKSLGPVRQKEPMYERETYLDNMRRTTNLRYEYPNSNKQMRWVLLPPR